MTTWPILRPMDRGAGVLRAILVIAIGAAAKGSAALRPGSERERERVGA